MSTKGGYGTRPRRQITMRAVDTIEDIKEFLADADARATLDGPAVFDRLVNILEENGFGIGEEEAD